VFSDWLDLKSPCWYKIPVRMKPEVLLIVNLVLLIVFILLLRKKASLTYCQGRKVWLTGLAITIITPMDELTSVFNAPAEDFHFIALSSIAFRGFY